MEETINPSRLLVLSLTNRISPFALVLHFSGVLRSKGTTHWMTSELRGCLLANIWGNFQEVVS